MEGSTDIPVRNNVLTGLDDHLFLFGGGQHQFDFLLGLRTPGDNDVRHFFENIERRKAHCSARGIEYFHVVFPSKPVIATDKLPAPYRDQVRSLFLSRYLATRPAGQEVIDRLLYPREVLKAAGATDRVFRVLDTHMTDQGNFVVADLLLRQLGLGYDPDRYFTRHTEALSGDLATMLDSPVRLPEQRLKDRTAPLYFDNRPFLSGNTNNVTVIHNRAALTQRRLLVFGDSFIKDGLRFYAPVFKDILFVRSTTFHTDLVELCAPDVVLTSNAERYLSSVGNDLSAPSLLLADFGERSARSEPFFEAFRAQLSWRHHRTAHDTWVKKLSPVPQVG
jgi:hypothetical protein